MSGGVTVCDRCGVRVATKFVDEDGECIGCQQRDARLVTDGGRDVDENRFDVDGGRRAEAAERQAEAMERLADEMEYQNAVLTEVAHALWYVAVGANEYSDPDERAERVPSHRGLRTNIDDQAFTREEDHR